MSNEAPKLYTHKPKKALLKKHLKQQSPSPSPSPSSGVTPTTVKVTPTTLKVTPTTVKVPPTPPKESFVRRYRFMWPLLLAVNFSVGAYLFMRTKKKEGVAEEVTAAISTPTSVISSASVAAVEPVKVREPIPLDQQLDILKWILEEKRKVKSNDPLEKKRLDEEKAILKQFIRAKSVPSI